MDQPDTQCITIQIKGVIEQNRREKEIASILRMLLFTREELNAYGLEEPSRKIRSAIDDLDAQLKASHN